MLPAIIKTILQLIHPLSFRRKTTKHEIQDVIAIEWSDILLIINIQVINNHCMQRFYNLKLKKYRNIRISLNKIELE